MGAALVLLLVALGAMAAGVLIGRYYVPDDRQLRRTARHSRAYMRALNHLIGREHEAVIAELRAVVEENVEDSEPYFALGGLFRSRGEHERAIRVHQALAVRERDRRKLRHRAMYELGLDFRAAGMPRRATRAMEKVLAEEPAHEGALRALAGLYEEQARFHDAAGMWQRLGRRRGEDLGQREHHLLVAAAQAAISRGDLDSARQLLKPAQKHAESAHLFAAAAELAAARGNHRGAKDRLTQALTADPGLAPHLLPALIAAEQGLAAQDRAGHPRGDRDDDDLEDGPPAQLPAPARAALPAATGDGSVPSTRGVGGADERASGAAATQVGAGAASGNTADRGVGGGGWNAGSGAAEHAPGAGAAVAGAASPAGASLALSGLVGALAVAPPGALVPKEPEVAMAPQGVPLVPEHRPRATIAERVLAMLAEIEAQCGPRLELTLIRAQLVPPADAAGQAALAAELVARFPGALAARVAAARLAIARGDDSEIRGALDALVADHGALAWTLRGRWQCAHCGHRPGPFSWRCAQCRRWSTLRMETGIEPPPVPPRDRRAAPRGARPDGELAADPALPAATLDPGLSEAELANAGTRRSLLGRVGGWFSGRWRRDAP
jgi:lipopolysaccharide biosynthesis regulator YciM